MQQSAIREPTNLSWARALILSTGIFFLSIIYMGQIPGFFLLASTQSNLARMEQSMLSMGLLLVGIALIGFTASFLYDPKPISSILVGIFGLIGAGFAGIGGIILLLVFTGTWHKYLPDGNWPFGQSYIFNPAWFQDQSIDLGSIGFVLFITGGGILTYVASYPFVRSGRLTIQIRNLIVRLAVVGASALVLAFLSIHTFSPDASADGPSTISNILLALALSLSLFALQVWLLPVMIAPENRQRFMPANYLHSIMLFGNAAIPLLLIFILLYPVVNLLATNLPQDNGLYNALHNRQFQQLAPLVKTLAMSSEQSSQRCSSHFSLPLAISGIASQPLVV
jgi:hypothetical protein